MLESDDRRPNDRPYYIDPCCDTCGAYLVYASSIEDPFLPIEEYWFDEFICPICQDGIYMDWPDDKLDGFLEQMDNIRFELEEEDDE